jgi:aminoglycoside phosphotransferase (APT) family kinase protein
MSVGSKPSSEVIVSPSLVQALLYEQHRDLAHLAPVKVAEGWDNALFRLGRELAVRLPRRAVAARLIEHEQRWLPTLAPTLPLPVPAPFRVGVPSGLFEWPWSVVRWLPGQSLLDDPQLDATVAASVLDRFLRALHRPAPPEAPKNPLRGVPLDARTETLHRHLAQLEGIVDSTAVLSLWDHARSAARYSGPAVWLHGDLHPGNLLVSEGRLAGVIDFGDLTSGDPATDLAVFWMLPMPIRPSIDAWPGTDVDALRLRARGWALALGLAYLAHSRDDGAMAALGRRTVDAALNEL